MNIRESLELIDGRLSEKHAMIDCAFEITHGQETLSSRKAVRIINRDSEHSGMRVLEQEQQM